MDDSFRTRALLWTSTAAVGTVLVRVPSLEPAGWFVAVVALATTATAAVSLWGLSQPSARVAAWIVIGVLVALGVVAGFTVGPALLLSAGLLGGALVVGHRRTRASVDDQRGDV